MKEIFTNVTNLRRKVFAEVAKLAYEGGDYSRIEGLPHKIVPGEKSSYRDNIFLERAIVGERLRLAIGLPVREVSEHKLISSGIEQSAIAEKYYDPPLVNVIKSACNACPTNKYFVTETCRGCLAHPCTVVCPVGAIYLENGKSKIDEKKCLKCGKCSATCPYGAIIKFERPCAKACGMNAISSDELGRAEIDYEKCVSCGQCMVNCPFGAIADKSQIFQIIQAIKTGKRVYAAVAPAFVGQFSQNGSPKKIRAAFKKLGFEDVVEVAIGADFCAVGEAEEFVKKVPAVQPFMGTSCCPAWSIMAKRELAGNSSYISTELTPMVFTGRMIKEKDRDAKVVFVGPCSAKKLEASRKSVRSDIDFVATFEEIMGMFVAKNVDFDSLEEDDGFEESTYGGRIFAVSGGVARAVVSCAKKLDSQREFLVESAQGLKNCRKMILLAKAGKRNGYLLEGMACPGGCVGGPGTLKQTEKAAKLVEDYASLSEKKCSCESSKLDFAKDLLK